MASTTIRVDTSQRDMLERFKLRLAGAIIRNITQGEALAVLCKLGEENLNECVKIAEEVL